MHPTRPMTPSDPTPAIDGEARVDLPPDEDEGGVGIGRLVDAILRRKWLVLALTLAGLGAGAALTNVVAPVYEAQATIHIETPPRSGAASTVGTPIRTSQLFDSRAWLELLRSFRVLDSVVKRERLYLTVADAADRGWFDDFDVDSVFATGTFVLTAGADGRLTLAGQNGSVIDRGSAGDSLGRGIGFRWTPRRVPAGRSISFSLITLRDAAVTLNAGLTAALPPQDGALMRLSLRGSDPEHLAATLNQVASSFVETAALLKREKLTVFTEVLEAQLQRAFSELRASEQALENFRVGTITLPTDRGGAAIAPGLAETRDPVFLAFFQLRVDRDGLANQREALARALRVPLDSSSSLVVSLGAIAAAQASAELSATLTDLATRRAEARRLRLAFTPEHPPLRALEREIDEIERVTLRAQAAEVLENLDAQIRDYDVRIAASSREMQQIPPRMSEEARLARAVSINNNLYTTLQASFEQAKLAELSAAPDVRVLDAAVAPRRPIRDQMLLLLVAGFAGGLALGVLLAILLDRFDSRIRYPDQITRGLGMSILGVVPLLQRDRRGQPLAESASQLLESLRAIRLSLIYAHGTAGPFVTTVTSPGSGEGKSFISAALARSFAEAGRRTLIIDGDTRRGVLHQTFGLSRKPGLLDVLSGHATIEQAVQRVPDREVDFIGGGRRMSAGPELLASAAMVRLLASLRERYQVIIIDSPPLGAGVDPLVLASLAGSMVLVLRNGVSDRELAESKVTELRRVPTRLLGAVLNDVSTRGTYRYYSYLPGYGAVDESGTNEASAPRSGRALHAGS